jgi:hypothetical protein
LCDAEHCVFQLTREEQKELEFGLILVYDALDFDQSGGVLFEALACGLTLFTKGSKSSKLGISFALFDRFC